MDLEKIIKILIYIHAGFGGIALVFGAIALYVKKGSKIHKKTGKVFYYSMLISIFISSIVAITPSNENPFLFLIGLFSFYFIISGYRSLKYKKKNFNSKLDTLIAFFIILTGVGMFIYSFVLNKKIDIILLVFGIAAIMFGMKDLKNIRKKNFLKKNWLRLHIGKMVGGYIAAVTAFLVVNQVFPGILNWFVPSIFGAIYITYQLYKIH